MATRKTSNPAPASPAAPPGGKETGKAVTKGAHTPTKARSAAGAGHRARLRGRILRHGPEGLADYELIEALLFASHPRRDTKATAKHFLAAFKGLAGLLGAEPSALAAAGASPKASALLALPALCLSHLAPGLTLRPWLLEGPERLEAYLQAAPQPFSTTPALHQPGPGKSPANTAPTRALRVLFLGSANNILADENLFTGGWHGALPLLARRCLLVGATALVVLAPPTWLAAEHGQARAALRDGLAHLGVVIHTMLPLPALDEPAHQSAVALHGPVQSERCRKHASPEHAKPAKVDWNARLPTLHPGQPAWQTLETLGQALGCLWGVVALPPNLQAALRQNDWAEGAEESPPPFTLADSVPDADEFMAGLTATEAGLEGAYYPAGAAPEWARGAEGLQEAQCPPSGKRPIPLSGPSRAHRIQSLGGRQTAHHEAVASLRLRCLLQDPLALRVQGQWAWGEAKPVEGTAMHLMVLRALCHRLSAARLEGLDLRQAPLALLHHLAVMMGNLGEEQFRVLFLNQHGHSVAERITGTGTVNQAPVYPREIARLALELQAHSVLVVHNHPSGDPTPSAMDKQMTDKVQDALALVGVELAEHIVVGATHCHCIMAGTLVGSSPSGRA
ncbi:hypothetical protein E3E12_08390 [Formicincola oecophyllae]|uniref:MPN domain-containing protein n=1 Tax=Formicincola oecophyllae TaxID=2558361 RepID=A0A4Y6UCT3_9PROT|nr:JAB domain-containing protein [Formicincola oecophyllae]QDH14201.1 hypothetical protein E3E12_08390 [Formicincola oecophyllae]